MKKAVLFFIIFIVGIGLAFFGLDFWLAKKIDKLINENPERQYDLLFENVDVNILRGRVELKHILLDPLEEGLPVEITGSVEQIIFSSLSIWDLIFNNAVDIGEIKLINPSFRLIKIDSLSNLQDNSKAFQNLFGDLISRGIVRDFVLEGGKAELLIQEDSLRSFGFFTDLFIHAKGLKTDKRIVTHVVPFELNQIQTGLKNLFLQMNSKQSIKIGAIDFDFLNESLSFQNVAMRYDQDIEKISFDEKYQKDLIEFELRELNFVGLDAESDLYGNWSIIADKMILDSLIFTDVRNKNKPRDKEIKKPMFAGMLSGIPIPLQIDTLQIRNSHLTYIEIPEGHSKGPKISFEKFHADIYGVISIDSLRRSKEMTMEVKTEFLGQTPIQANFTVPYNQELFKMNLNLGAMDLTILNPIIEPMAALRVESGKLRKLSLQMDSWEVASNNQMVFDYEGLKLEVLKDGTSKQKNSLLSVIGNIAIRSENLPEKKNYRIANYQTKRNVYRSPFNFIWESTKGGLQEITPGGLTKLLTGRKDSEGKQEKNQKK